MKVLISAHTLDYSGVPTYTFTLYNELKKRGHDVYVYSPNGGPFEKEMITFKSMKGVKTPDVFIGQCRDCTEKVAELFPSVPKIFISHGTITVHEEPPSANIDYYVAVNETVVGNLVRLGVEGRNIALIRDFIDTDEFSPRTPVSSKLSSVLYISNRRKGRAYMAVMQACRRLGVRFNAIGAPHGSVRQVSDAINEVDLVVSIGRGILEGMACGRAVISFDRSVVDGCTCGDGYLTRKAYEQSKHENFTGRTSGRVMNTLDMINEMERYVAGDGLINRSLAVDHHDVRKGVDSLLSIVKKL